MVGLLANRRSEKDLCPVPLYVDSGGVDGPLLALGRIPATGTAPPPMILSFL